MAKADMSRKAVTVRILRTAQLRKLCLQIRKRPAQEATRQPRGRKEASAK